MITAADIQFTPELSEKSIEIAIKLFRLRQARNMYVEVNPSWEALTELYYQKALLNERGSTAQQQCIMQAIRLVVWESGQIPAKWSDAFPLPYVARKPQSLPTRWYQRVTHWYRRLRDTYRRLKSRFNDNV